MTMWKIILALVVGMVLTGSAWATDGDFRGWGYLSSAVSSKPVEKDGLQVTVTLPKATFAADEQPKFTVQFKNVSDKPITLSEADFYWAWSIRFEDVTRKGPWKLELQDVGKLKLQQHLRAEKVDTLQPGKTLEVAVDLGEKGLAFEYVWEGEQKGQVAPDRGREGRLDSASPPAKPDGRISRIRLSS